MPYADEATASCETHIDADVVTSTLYIWLRSSISEYTFMIAKYKKLQALFFAEKTHVS